MNNIGQVGFAWLIVFFLVAITTFALIEPLKESLDNNRDGGDLNCPSAPSFNEADYNNDTQFERLVRRPTCFVTGISMVWFVVVVLISGLFWVVAKWKKSKR